MTTRRRRHSGGGGGGACGGAARGVDYVVHAVGSGGVDRVGGRARRGRRLESRRQRHWQWWRRCEQQSVARVAATPVARTHKLALARARFAASRQPPHCCCRRRWRCCISIVVGSVIVTIVIGRCCCRVGRPGSRFVTGMTRRSSLLHSRTNWTFSSYAKTGHTDYCVWGGGRE